MEEDHATAPSEHESTRQPETALISGIVSRLAGQNQRLALLMEQFAVAEAQRRMVFEERIFELRSVARQALDEKDRLEHASARSKAELAAMSAQAARFADRASQCQERLDAAQREVEVLKRELNSCRDRLADSERARHEAQDALRSQREVNQELKRDLDRLQRQWQQIIDRDR
ncbi:hypothetical protein NNJEOMEG_00142 [Fundidesulfovibrio magnetotacticus]|uniref:Uncharacterized protein n=1 Tax=Fundidesulfovibrio magnetotacticus TaxID=2730080 RepID=A0A6V8LPR1_9BACT|nr:hypothetical protein [Fundidesulfovibrio magnetotacticus]GFK92318.1 hypothetical protein NNJEOMEG_00142 [Fundidesulfovibrio magnetotacticus]